MGGSSLPRSPAGPAERRWSAALAEWAIPQEILDRAPESPWGFPPSLFRAAHEDLVNPDTPSHQRALEALPEGGIVLDVGVGAGRSSLPLVARAGCVVGVDESESMLASFADAAGELGVRHRTVQGRWPEIASEAGAADVVVCHHVLYNVSQLSPFVGALTAAARRRVVAEITASHPQLALNELWLHFHGLERPTRPTFSDALAVLEEMGLDVKIERWQRRRAPHSVDRAKLVAFVRRRLCLPADKDPEVDALLAEDHVTRPMDLVTLWWEPARPTGAGAKLPA